jgi:CBS-domain-containing membrane protein
MPMMAKKQKKTARPPLGRIASAAAEATAIAEIMTPTPLCVPPELSVESLTSLFLERGISGAPVVDEAGRAIGIVSKTDLVRERFIEGDTAVLPDGFHVEQLDGATVMDVMMPLAFTLRATDSIGRAARLMATEHIHRVPVTDLEGRVIGIVTTFDLARWITAS